MLTIQSDPAGARAPRKDATDVSAPWLLRRVNQRYGAAVAARLERAGLGTVPRPGYWALLALGSGARDASQLVAAMGVTKQAVSKVLESLAAEGLVRRTPHAADRRRSDLTLTSKGTRAVALIREALATTEHAFVAEVGADAWGTTVATLAALARRQP